MEEQIEATETIRIYVPFNICRRSNPKRILPKTYSMRPLRLVYEYLLRAHCVLTGCLLILMSKYKQKRYIYE